MSSLCESQVPFFADGSAPPGSSSPPAVPGASAAMALAPMSARCAVNCWANCAAKSEASLETNASGSACCAIFAESASTFAWRDPSSAAYRAVSASTFSEAAASAVRCSRSSFSARFWTCCSSSCSEAISWRAEATSCFTCASSCCTFVTFVLVLPRSPACSSFLWVTSYCSWDERSAVSRRMASTRYLRSKTSEDLAPPLSRVMASTRLSISTATSEAESWQSRSKSCSNSSVEVCTSSCRSLVRTIGCASNAILKPSRLRYPFLFCWQADKAFVRAFAKAARCLSVLCCWRFSLSCCARKNESPITPLTRLRVVKETRRM
mmetsp:Transcript_94669/g.276811  ORF Transcript_94669/g.276811 Transcript_94669/m.276811 type:complete len:322 (-) Transcript_94669:1108-2073(-)